MAGDRYFYHNDSYRFDDRRLYLRPDRSIDPGKLVKGDAEMIIQKLRVYNFYMIRLAGFAITAFCFFELGSYVEAERCSWLSSELKARRSAVTVKDIEQIKERLANAHHNSSAGSGREADNRINAGADAVPGSHGDNAGPSQQVQYAVGPDSDCLPVKGRPRADLYRTLRATSAGIRFE